MNSQPAISLSIAVVCFNSDPEELARLLQSLLDSADYLSSRARLESVLIFIIDNSETELLNLDQFEGIIASSSSLKVNMELVSGQGNIGYGSAHNLVLKTLESDFHLILNPDVVVDSQCLFAGVSYLVENPQVSMASPLACNAVGERQYLCKRYPSVLTLLLRGFLPPRWQMHFFRRLASYERRDLDLDTLDVMDEIEIASGCFMLCRTNLLKKVAGFDERYFLYFEDFDLSLKLASAGKIAFLPTMKIVHHGGNASKKGIKHILMFMRSGIRFFNTHGWRWIKQ